MHRTTSTTKNYPPLNIDSEGEVTQSCPTLCDPMNCSLPGSSIHGILQARVLEWVAISFSRGSSRPRDRTWVSCIVGRCFTIWATREVSAVATFNQLFSSVVSQDSNIYNHRGTCKKCKFLSPIWDLQNQKSWAWNPEICIQTRSCPSDSCAHWSLRIIGLKFKSYFINTWRTLGYALYLGEQLTGTQHHFLTLAHL